jgi:hypothetical protein
MLHVSPCCSPPQRWWFVSVQIFFGYLLAPHEASQRCTHLFLRKPVKNQVQPLTSVVWHFGVGTYQWYFVGYGMCHYGVVKRVFVLFNGLYLAKRNEVFLFYVINGKALLFY